MSECSEVCATEVILMDLDIRKKNVVEVLVPLTDEELDAVTVVFHQFETGLREGCIFTKVKCWQIIVNTFFIQILFFVVLL